MRTGLVSEIEGVLVWNEARVNQIAKNWGALKFGMTQGKGKKLVDGIEQSELGAKLTVKQEALLNEILKDIKWTSEKY